MLGSYLARIRGGEFGGERLAQTWSPAVSVYSPPCGCCWQVERDLLDASPEVWEATRTRIATEGFGARLLALQDADGQWDGGSFFPADYDFAGAEGPKVVSRDRQHLDVKHIARVGP